MPCRVIEAGDDLTLRAKTDWDGVRIHGMLYYGYRANRQEDMP